MTFVMIFIGEHIGYIFYKIVWWKKYSLYLYDIIKDLMNYDIIARKRHITIVSYLWAWVLSTYDNINDLYKSTILIYCTFRRCNCVSLWLYNYSSNPTNYNTSVDSKTLQLLSCCNLKNIENSEKIQNTLDFSNSHPNF